jgi:hypothetical protein
LARVIQRATVSSRNCSGKLDIAPILALGVRDGKSYGFNAGLGWHTTASQVSLLSLELGDATAILVDEEGADTPESEDE